MKVFEIRDGFGLDHLVATERPDPEPGPGQVLVRTAAVSLNYRDLMTVAGTYNPRQPLPLVPCSDAVGEIVAVGPGVTQRQVGERVATLFAPTWQGGRPSRERLRKTLGGPLDGTLAELLALDDDAVVPVPEYLRDVEAATLPCAALTAWSAIVTHGCVGAGDTVLVQGTGGVSLFALQFAQLFGARVIVTSSSAAKLDAVREMGSWGEIDYVQNPEWGRRARELTDGLGVDHVVEVGGAATLAQSLRAVRIGGQISLIGVLAGAVSELDVRPMLMQHVRLQGILVGSREGFEAMLRAVEQHRLRPRVHRVFPFAETREAFAYMAGGQHLGKICIDLR